MSLADLKKKSNTAIDRLREQMNPKQGAGKFQPDPNYWRPTLDKEKGTGYAVIRFLPEPEGEDFPVAKFFEHSFAGATGKKYFERSLTSIGQKDPVGELNSRLWNSGVESDKDVARLQKRKAKYVSNIYVIKDPAHPENEGKVFKYVYGEKIWQMIEGKMSPEVIDGEDPVESINPFDFWKGANFVMRIRTLKTGEQAFWNYDKSTFDVQSAFLNGDETKLADIYKQLHSLKEINDPKHYKPYDVLQKRLLEVLGQSVGSGIATVVGATSSVVTTTTGNSAGSNTPSIAKPAVVKVAPAPASTAEAAIAVNADEDEEEYFRKLMAEGEAK